MRRSSVALGPVVWLALFLAGCGGGGGNGGTEEVRPTGLSATPANGRVTLVWNAVPGATDYAVYRASSSGGAYSYVGISGGSTTYAVTGLTNGEPRYFVVSAAVDGAWTPYSSEVSATPYAARIAVVHDAALTDAQAYETLLEARGHTVDLVAQSAIQTTSFTGHDLIIIAQDTHGLIDATEAGVLDAAGKPFIGIGSAGLIVFDRLGLYTRGGNCASGSITGVVVIDASSPIWKVPEDLGVQAGASVALYDPACSSQELYSGYVPSAPGSEDVHPLASGIGTPGYLPLLIEGDRYLYWGFGGSPSTMTDAGRRLFVNAVEYMVYERG